MQQFYFFFLQGFFDRADTLLLNKLVLGFISIEFANAQDVVNWHLVNYFLINNLPSQQGCVLKLTLSGSMTISLNIKMAWSVYVSHGIVQIFHMGGAVFR